MLKIIKKKILKLIMSKRFKMIYWTAKKEYNLIMLKAEIKIIILN